MNLNRPLIVCSSSPRRKEIMERAGFSFHVKVKNTDEYYDNNLIAELVPEFLAKKKALAFKNEIQDEIILSADTVVILEGEILNKPKDEQEAKDMLRRLSGKAHKVITGVCIMTKESINTFSDATTVYFSNLEEWEIEYYIKTCKPFDKAGGYGVQDFIGMVGIYAIEGSFYTVMGLPIHKVYQHLVQFLEK